MNKIFCTFVNIPELEERVEYLGNNYSIVFGKMFVLYAKEQDEYLLTYNVEILDNFVFPENTILVHRKKETNTLYTINALNLLVKTLNNGVFKPGFKIVWENYRNSVLLTRKSELHKVDTELYKIVNIKKKLGVRE